MPIDPQDLQKHIEDFGPYLYHGTFEDAVPYILRDGILPRGQTGAKSDWDEPRLESRPGHVYLAHQHYISTLGRPPYIRVDLRKLDPALIDSDEDHLERSMMDYPEKWDQDSDYYKEAPTEENYYALQFLKSEHPWPAHYPQSMGEWADKYAGRVDHPQNVAGSLARGSIAVRGGVPSEAVSINPDESHPGDWEPAHPEDRRNMMASRESTFGGKPSGLNIEHYGPDDYRPSHLQTVDYEGNPTIYWGPGPERAGHLVNATDENGNVKGALHYSLFPEGKNQYSGEWNPERLYVNEMHVHPDYRHTQLAYEMGRKMIEYHPGIPIASMLAEPRLAPLIERYNRSIGYDSNTEESDIMKAVSPIRQMPSKAPQTASKTIAAQTKGTPLDWHEAAENGLERSAARLPIIPNKFVTRAKRGRYLRGIRKFGPVMPHKRKHRSAVNPQWWDTYVQQHPYSYHVHVGNAADLIQEHGLLPHGQVDPMHRENGYGGIENYPRPNHAYVSDEHHIYSPKDYEPYTTFKIDNSQLDPEKIDFDEDFVPHFFGQAYDRNRFKHAGGRGGFCDTMGQTVETPDYSDLEGQTIHIPDIKTVLNENLKLGQKLYDGGGNEYTYQGTSTGPSAGHVIVNGPNGQEFRTPEQARELRTAPYGMPDGEYASKFDRVSVPHTVQSVDYGRMRYKSQVPENTLTGFRQMKDEEITAHGGYPGSAPPAPNGVPGGERGLWWINDETGEVRKYNSLNDAAEAMAGGDDSYKEVPTHKIRSMVENGHMILPEGYEPQMEQMFGPDHPETVHQQIQHSGTFAVRDGIPAHALSVHHEGHGEDESQPECDEFYPQYGDPEQYKIYSVDDLEKYWKELHDGAYEFLANYDNSEVDYDNCTEYIPAGSYPVVDVHDIADDLIDDPPSEADARVIAKALLAATEHETLVDPAPDEINEFVQMITHPGVNDYTGVLAQIAKMVESGTTVSIRNYLPDPNTDYYGGETLKKLDVALERAISGIHPNQQSFGDEAPGWDDEMTDSLKHKFKVGDRVMDTVSGSFGVVVKPGNVTTRVIYDNFALHAVPNSKLQKGVGGPPIPEESKKYIAELSKNPFYTQDEEIGVGSTPPNELFDNMHHTNVYTSAMIPTDYPLAGEPGWGSVPKHVMDWLQDTKPGEQFGHESDCISPKCQHDWTDEERHQLAQYGEVKCPACGTLQNINGDYGPYYDNGDLGPTRGAPGKRQPGGTTRAGLSLKQMGDIGETLVERANNLPCGMITHHFEVYNNPVDFTTVDQHGNHWGVEVKTIDSRVTPRFKLGGAAEVAKKVQYCYDHQLRQGLIGVRLNFYTDEADLFWRPQFTDPYLGDTTMQHVGTLNFADLNPFRDPATGDHNVPQETSQEIPF